MMLVICKYSRTITASAICILLISQVKRGLVKFQNKLDLTLFLFFLKALTFIVPVIKIFFQTDSQADLQRDKAD